MSIFDDEYKINSFSRFIIFFLLLTIFNIITIVFIISSHIMINIGLDNVIGLLMLFGCELIILLYVTDKYSDLIFSPSKMFYIKKSIQYDNINKLIKNYEKIIK